MKKIKTASHDRLQVILTAKVIHDDVFQLFHSQEGETGFTTKKSIKTRVQGNTDFQDIVFNVPSINNLNRLRLDIGTNKNQGPISIEKIVFLNDREKIEYDIEAFNRLFKTNNYIKKIDDKGTFKGLVSKRKKKDFYDPYFVSRQTSRELDALRSQNLVKYPFLVSMLAALVILLFAFYNIEFIRISKETVFIAIFLIILILPASQSLFSIIKPAKNLEKRTLTPKPEFKLSEEYPQEYEAYFNDNFGLRNYLINWGGAYRTKLFRSSMHPELVKFGKNDWLFYNRVQGKIFKSYTNSNLLSKDTLNRVVAKWEKNKKRYNGKGIKYFLTFWPNKHTIYPEYLPGTMNAQIKDTISRVDQILNYLKDTKSPIMLFDPRPALMEGKKRNQLYHKFDTHWNDLGAFLGYQAFFNANRDELGIRPKSIDDFNIEWADFKKGELIQMLGVNNDGYFVEKAPKFDLKDNENQIEFLSVDGYPKQTKITRNKHCGNKLKVLVFRDSFTTKLIQFLSLHFYEVTYIWGHSERFVDELKPDIIIEGYVERGTGQKIQ
ncbi:alginate O-acetyltransferase AlgX-related protein [Flagellimonas sp.]|uniref:alginate O-acetyltransferase AlgX-related protein n=1 Tax=Flagellimonas sp. TaxID=2058762 RepID=UPI003B5915B0